MNLKSMSLLTLWGRPDRAAIAERAKAIHSKLKRTWGEALAAAWVEARDEEARSCPTLTAIRKSPS
jgi:hypothetical protein